MISAVTVTTSPTEVLAAPTGRPYQFVAGVSPVTSNIATLTVT